MIPVLIIMGFLCRHWGGQIAGSDNDFKMADGEVLEMRQKLADKIQEIEDLKRKLREKVN